MYSSLKSIIILTFIVGFLVATSSGYALGRKGSPIWNKTTSQDKIDEYYDSMPTYELCIEWAKRWDSTGPRRNIARSLSKRGEDPLKCNNPGEDAAKETKQRLDKLERQLRWKD